jgi:hypothetical protein
MRNNTSNVENFKVKGKNQGVMEGGAGGLKA